MKGLEEGIVLDMDGIITRLGELKAHCANQREWEGTGTTWQTYEEVCSEAVNVLYTLLDSGAHTAEEVKDLVHDYKALAKQYQAMYKRFGTAGHAVHKDGVWHCPSCNKRVNPGHSFCHTCGKKLDWIPNGRIAGRRSRR